MFCPGFLTFWIKFQAISGPGEIKFKSPGFPGSAGNPAIGTIPDRWGRILHVCYADLYVQVKWYRKLSNPINIDHGTIQGCLTSPYMFNIFYQSLAEVLSETTGSIRINMSQYHVFIYADDLLIVSTLVTGLQNLINSANHYITENGCIFNATKTS